MLYVFPPFDNPDGIAEADRRQFANSCLKQLGLDIAKTGFKKRENVLFCRAGDFFASVTCTVASNRWESRVDIQIKPYDLDPLLWHITKLDTKGLPASARAFIGRQCQVPIWRRLTWNDKELNPSENCRKMFEAKGVIDQLIAGIANQSFADLIIAAEDLNVPRHTQVLALVLEQRFDDAKVMVKKFLDEAVPGQGGTIMISMSPDEKSRDVLEFILDWIESDDRRELVPNSNGEAP